MSFSKAELKFLEDNKDLFAELLEKQKEIDKNMEALAKPKMLRQYKDPIRQQKYLENELAKTNSRANMIKRIMKKLSAVDVKDIPVDLTPLEVEDLSDDTEEYKDTPLDPRFLREKTNEVALDKKTIKQLQKLMK